MESKLNQNPLLAHRPRKRRHLILDPKNNQKSQNLKALHQTLLYDNATKKSYLNQDKGSAVQLITQNKNSHSFSRKPIGSISKQKDRPVNFYINIQKLRNLKISSKEKQPKRTQSYQSIISTYAKRDKLHAERKSQLLKNYGVHKKGHNYHSYDSNLNNVQDNTKNKGKNRYGTQADDEPIPNNISTKTKSVFKRANNEMILKDKTFIEGYLRGKQLGRGGFSKVWQGFHFKTKKFYAVKQIDTTNKYQTHLTQIWFGNFFFDNGEPKQQFLSYPGISSLLTMYTYSIVDPRAFIVYENCNGSLGNMLYDIYQEDRDDDINEDEKLYMIKYKPLYNELKKNSKFLKTMMIQISQALDLFSKYKIVHSDIKTQNILIKVNQEAQYIHQFKLIDYGSSFVFQNLKQYKLATPQYMCPELLNYILFQNKKPHKEQMLQYIKNYQNISAIDVWGVGCIIVELIHGLPLWLSNRTKILVNGKYQTKKGLFAVNDRSFAKILQKQLNLVDNFQFFIKKQNNSGIIIDQDIKTILQRMLQPNPSKRIRPNQIISILKQKS